MKNFLTIIQKTYKFELKNDSVAEWQSVRLCEFKSGPRLSFFALFPMNSINILHIQYILLYFYIVCFHRPYHQKLPDQGRERSRPIWQVRQLEAAGSIPLPLFLRFCTKSKNSFCKNIPRDVKNFCIFLFFEFSCQKPDI